MAERNSVWPGHTIAGSSIDSSSVNVKHSTPRHSSVQDEPIRILVVGITGSGKSTLIKNASGHDVGIGHEGDSCTQICQRYPTKYDIDGKKFELIDTPGFDDPKRNDFEILKDIIGFLDGVSGVIYCHRINETRLIMDSKLNLDIIKAMCGKRFHSRVVVCSTMWDTLSEDLTPQQLEKHRERMEQLLSTGFRSLMESGAKYMEFRADQPNACLDILKSFSSQRLPPRLAILEQLSQMRSVQETDSGKVLEEEHRRRAEEGKLSNQSSSRARDVEHKDAPKKQKRDNKTDKRGWFGKYGQGEHQWNVTLARLSMLLKYINYIEILYGPLMFSAKFVVMRQIESIFLQHKDKGISHLLAKTLIWANLFFYGGWMLSFILACIPREKIWNPEIPGRCINNDAALIASSAINILSDVTILLLPLAAILHLQMIKTGDAEVIPWRFSV
ncbi:hypothetical protein GQX73_g669 [Xylaria multiplex]|uniref:Uncharacterized protein n=1 Tax=Xylaria multiplex TaxID=323545 RepID=A0A7C8IV05_9PEZI|nr:hypothetical protein GQX73_g669 [Xylaria multiplex]